MKKHKIKDAIRSEFSDENKKELADRLINPVSDMLLFGSYNRRMDKKYLTKTLFWQAKQNERVLAEYREFKSSMGIFAIIAWPIFKMVLMWVIREVIKNWGE